MLIELSILLGVAAFGCRYDHSLVAKEIFAGSLLFAMGLQNSLVSIVVGSVARTTHLTGSFTDLGIETGQVLQKNTRDHAALKTRIKLRSAIIFFFMYWAMAGAYLFRHFSLHAFLIPMSLLAFTLLYDVYRIRVTGYYRLHHPFKKVL
ncbi:MAG: hypothetical protein JWP78_1178 [Mucilaginibacter sp.]|nr:hypothetical protein [Mucilaginibacter sp.]